MTGVGALAGKVAIVTGAHVVAGDVLLDRAGIHTSAPVDQVTEADFRRVLDADLVVDGGHIARTPRLPR